MLGGKVLSNSIDKAVIQHKRDAFAHFATKMAINDSQIGCILAFRKLCLKYDRTRQEKYFHRWYRNGLKPKCLLRLNEELTDHQLKHEFLRKMLKKWNEQYFQSQKRNADNH